MIEVCAAVVRRADGRLLVARRTRPESLAGLWEFPGGKLEPGEDGAMCLRREIAEELDLAIEVGAALGASERGPEAGAPLRLVAYAARPASPTGAPRLVDGTHDSLRWVDADELRRLDLAPLDVPLVEPALRFLDDPDAHLR